MTNQQASLKVNLGCGPVGKDDWINVDWGILAILHKIPFAKRALSALNVLPDAYNVKWPGNLVLHNCKYKLPFKDASVDFVYASHFLEHFKKYEAMRLLQDCLRIMKPGATIRIIVPDLELLARKYVEKDSAYLERLGTLLTENSGSKVLPADLLVQAFYPDFNMAPPRGLARFLVKFMKPHQWMYDFQTLSDLLENSGFRDVRHMQHRQGVTPDLDVLDVLPETSLYVEAVK